MYCFTLTCQKGKFSNRKQKKNKKSTIDEDRMESLNEGKMTKDTTKQKKGQKKEKERKVKKKYEKEQKE